MHHPFRILLAALAGALAAGQEAGLPSANFTFDFAGTRWGRPLDQPQRLAVIADLNDTVQSLQADPLKLGAILLESIRLNQTEVPTVTLFPILPCSALAHALRKERKLHKSALLLSAVSAIGMRYACCPQCKDPCILTRASIEGRLVLMLANTFSCTLRPLWEGRPMLALGCLARPWQLCASQAVSKV